MKMIIRTDMQRNPYYIIRALGYYWLLRRGIVKEIYPHDGLAIQLYLSDEEAQKYNPDRIRELLSPYFNIVRKGVLYLPRELLLYAIEQCIFGGEK